ncbi:MAG: hypothetical protein KHZ83_11655 [Roseburia sp.]|nr:hypothetical protein [Roseburia sp.]
MIENMKVEFGRTSDIDSWMRLVRKVSWNFPGLETEQSIDEHKIIVLKFMNDNAHLTGRNQKGHAESKRRGEYRSLTFDERTFDIW